MSRLPRTGGSGPFAAARPAASMGGKGGKGGKGGEELYAVC